MCVESCACPSSCTSIKPGRWRLIIRAPISGLLGKFPAKQDMKARKDGDRSDGGFVPVPSSFMSRWQAIPSSGPDVRHTPKPNVTFWGARSSGCDISAEIGRLDELNVSSGFHKHRK